MNKKIIAGVIIVILLLVGGLAVLSSNTPVSTPNPPEQQVSAPATQSATPQETAIKTVEYTKNGFEPQTLTIKQGEAVTWINKSNDQMWIASDPHPSHTSYSGFDQLNGEPNGGVYSFTFTKVGTWAYHNHLNASKIGTIVVTQ